MWRLWRVKWRSPRIAGCTSVQPWIVDFRIHVPAYLIPEVGSAADRREVVTHRRNRSVFRSAASARNCKGAVTYGGLGRKRGLALAHRQDQAGAGYDSRAGRQYRHYARRRACPKTVRNPAYDILLGSVSEIAEHGASGGVYTLRIETGQESPQALGDFIDEVGSPWLKVNYDPCNLLQFRLGRGNDPRAFTCWAIRSFTRTPRTGIRRRGKPLAAKGWCPGTDTYRH